jgi:cytochrome c peroxidase
MPPMPARKRQAPPPHRFDRARRESQGCRDGAIARANAASGRGLPPTPRRFLAAVVAVTLAWATQAERGALANEVSSAAAAPGVPGLTADERARIIAFGHWPPVAATPEDPTLASRTEAAALGELLFNSARLSGDGRLRCASCHEPWRLYTDRRSRALGRIVGARNTPSLMDVSLHRMLGWDGTFDRLDAQSLRPLRDADEMGAAPSHVAALVRRDALLRARYVAAFGAAPPASDDALFEDVGRALATYEATLVSGRTTFDALRDALAAEAAGAPAESRAGMEGAALRGLRLFLGRAACANCHSGPAFSDDALHISTTHSRRPDGTPDMGRAGGPAYAFRTPTLRGVASTAPYMHDGHVESLCDAVRPHALDDSGEADPAGAKVLDAAERTDLVAFLRALDAAPVDDIETDIAAPCHD